MKGQDATENYSRGHFDGYREGFERGRKVGFADAARELVRHQARHLKEGDIAIADAISTIATALRESPAARGVRVDWDF